MVECVVTLRIDVLYGIWTGPLSPADMVFILGRFCTAINLAWHVTVVQMWSCCI